MSKDATSELNNAAAALTLADNAAAPAPAPAAAGGDDASAAAAPAASDEPLVKHPLEHRWTYFYNPPTKAAADGSWSSNVKSVSTFDTVEDFWSLFNALKSPSQLTIGSNYHLFKEGIQPEWEDPQNRKGGKWTVAFQRRGGDAGAARISDDAWQNALLALIGEQFGADSDEICGVVVGPRGKETRIALWTRTGEDEDVQKRIGNFFKREVLGCDVAITYQLHDESMKKGSSHRSEIMYKC
jgi:translation initiation factor 4E